MRHLVIVCHPRRRSFTQTIAHAYAQEVESLGHETVRRDLYALGFDPVLGERELPGAARRTVPAVVRREQRHIAAAGALTFIFPLWWSFMPAMMKGYFDRVFSAGFAYDIKNEEMIPRLRGKRALIFTSSGADMEYLRDSGQWRAMQTLEKDHILALAGIDLLEHVNFPSVLPDMPKREIDQHVKRLRQTVQRHWAGAPVARG